MEVTRPEVNIFTLRPCKSGRLVFGKSIRSSDLSDFARVWSTYWLIFWSFDWIRLNFLSTEGHSIIGATHLNIDSASCHGVNHRNPPTRTRYIQDFFCWRRTTTHPCHQTSARAAPSWTCQVRIQAPVSMSFWTTMPSLLPGKHADWQKKLHGFLKSSTQWEEFQNGTTNDYKL